MSRALSIVLVGLLCMSCIMAQEHCGDTCKTDPDCGNDPDCSLCFSGICGAGCGSGCVGDSDCRDLNCRYCAQGVCQNSPQRTCGQSCKVNTDCNQDGSNLCQLCQQGTCVVGCGQECTNSSQCGSSCSHCILGVCAQDNVPCNGLCHTDLDCDQGTVCSMCVNGKCGVGCGKPCGKQTDCLDTNCQYCTSDGNGGMACAHTQNGKTCHQPCKVNTDCTGSPGTCQFCVGFHCGSPCAAPCKQSSDCITNHCNSCNSTGFCSH